MTFLRRSKGTRSVFRVTQHTVQMSQPPRPELEITEAQKRAREISDQAANFRERQQNEEWEKKRVKEEQQARERARLQQLRQEQGQANLDALMSAEEVDGMFKGLGATPAEQQIITDKFKQYRIEINWDNVSKALDELRAVDGSGDALDAWRLQSLPKLPEEYDNTWAHDAIRRAVVNGKPDDPTVVRGWQGKITGRSK